MKKAIKKRIIKLLDELKPEFDNIVFTIDTGKVFSEKDKNKMILATCSYLTEPKVINFYLGSIESLFNDRLKSIIRHEIAHLFTRSEEEAKKFEKDAKIFKEKIW